MIARLFAILVTVTLPLQGLAVPHCHGENVSGKRVDHDQAPHIHFGHGHHHEHQSHSHHEGNPPQDEGGDGSSEMPGQSHDGDAVFVTVELVVDHAPVRVLTSDLSVGLAANDVSPRLALDSFRRWVQEPPPDIGGLPLFLMTASLRL